MSWKNHDDGSLITNEQHQALSDHDKAKFYETSEEVIVASPKKQKNGKAVDSESDSIDQA